MTPASEHAYGIYGLRVASEIPLPELSERSTAKREPEADLVICRQLLPASDACLDSATNVYDDPRSEFSVYQTDEKLYWFYDGVGTLAVSDGRLIEVAPVPTLDSETLARFVLGPGFCGALVQRGSLVLHASTVTIDGVTVAFAGESGRGKSTAAAACYAQGHDVVTEDLTPIHTENEPRVEPGYPQLRVDEIVADTLGLSDRIAGRTTGKIRIDVSDRFEQDPQSLDVVYLLERGDEFESKQLPSQAGVFQLLRTSYSLYDDADTTRQQEHLDACSVVAESCSIRRLTRPSSLARLDDLVEFVASDATCET